MDAKHVVFDVMGHAVIINWKRGGGNFNHWQVSWKETEQILSKRRHGCEKGITISHVCVQKNEQTDNTALFGAVLTNLLATILVVRFCKSYW